MSKVIPKISVLVITYNQENIISRAIDSLLAQKDYIFEICVSDDCSQDGTWGILKKYSDSHPGLFVLNRNDPNVGYFENVEKTWTMPSGDMIYVLAGDDEVGEGWFKKVVDFIQEQEIDIKNERFCIYGDYRYVYPNGSSFVFSNSMVTSGIDPVRLSLRWKIGNRSCCFSINVLKRFKPVSQGRSHIAETAQDRQLQLFSDKVYYINHIGNVYYAEIGISTKIFDNPDVFAQRLSIMPYAESFLRNNGYIFDHRDRYLSKFVQSIDYYNKEHSLKSKIRLIYYTLLTYDSKIDSFGGLLRRLGSVMIH